MAKRWQRMISGKDDGKTDYSNMCELFSELSGAGVRYEKHGDTVTLYTDGDPREVIGDIIVGGIFTLAVLDNIESVEKETKFERNARMN